MLGATRAEKLIQLKVEEEQEELRFVRERKIKSDLPEQIGGLNPLGLTRWPPSGASGSLLG